MIEKEMLLRDIRTVRQTINRDWADLTHLSLSHDERAEHGSTGEISFGN